MRAQQLRQGLIVAALILLVAWLGYLIWGLAGKADVAWKQAKETKAAYAQLEARKLQLQANIASLNTPRGKDSAMREAFGVALPGEAVIVVVPPKEASTTPEKKWWQHFFWWQ